MESTRKEHLVQTAFKLFYRQGYRHTGVNAVLKESHVAKMTLYKHFGSKEDLVLAALKQQDQRFRAWFSDALRTRAFTPRDRLIAVFDVLQEWSSDTTFFGCPFINAAIEYKDIHDPIHIITAQHKVAICQLLQQLSEEAGANDPLQLAQQIAILKDGALVLIQVTGDRSYLKQAKHAAQILVHQALQPLH